MQTSLRSNYQYYDYGTLDCTTRHIQHLPDHDLSNHHIHLPAHQLQQEQEQEQQQQQQQQHHHQLQQQQTVIAHHQVELIHHHHHQTLISDTPYDQQDSAPNEPSNCFALIDLQNNETAHQSNTNNLIENQPIVYDHHQQQHHYHQLLNSSNHLTVQQHQQQHIHRLERGDQNSNQNEEVDEIYNHHQLASQLIHPPVIAADPTANSSNNSQEQQLETPTQIPSTSSSSYPTTIYYEPINYTDSCAIELLQQQQQQQHHNVINESPQAFTGHLLDVSQFVSLQQQPGGSTAEEGCTYFQYQQPEQVVVIDEHRQANEQHTHRKHEAPSLDNNNQENQNYDNHHQQHVGMPACEQPTGQTYRTLEISGVDSMTTFASTDTNLHHTNQLLNHSYHQQHSLNDAIELSNVVEHQEDYQQQESKNLNGGGYQLVTKNCYINSECTSATSSTSRSQASPACSTSSSSSSSSSEESSNSTLTRDEKRAREANIPLTYQQIVNLSIDQFNEQLAKHNLTESQLTLIKDIRRRGKNKVAAQSCRKRKMEQIYELQHEVDHLSVKKRSLNSECNQLMREHDDLVQKYNKIYPIIHCFNKDTWNP